MSWLLWVFFSGLRLRNREKGEESRQKADGVCDRISELPSNILGSILFLLPIKEACRTTTLSTRWRHVFASSPVELDDEKVSKRRRRGGRPSETTVNANRVAVITKIVAAHRGPFCRVHLAKTRFHGDDGNTYGIGLATDLFVGQNVEELILHSAHSVQFFPTDSLRSLHLIGCAWFPSQPPAATFTRIRELTLRGVKISEPDLHALMEQCPKLEDLTLSSYHEEERGGMHREQVDIARFLVRSKSLRNLSLELCSLAEVVLVDAPNLEHLLGVTMTHQRSRCAVILVHAPKLQILGWLCTHFDLLFFYNTYKIEGMDLSLPVARPPIRSVKILSVRVNLWDLGDIKHVYNHVTRSPCFTVEQYADFLELARSVPCLKNSVKIITMSCFCGCDPELQFARILLGSARVLKVMEIFGRFGDKARIRTERRRLDAQRKASSSAQVVLSKNTSKQADVGDFVLNSY
ncbi:hypothetical protein ABZP36_013094 [Zizania latifolia]